MAIQGEQNYIYKLKQDAKLGQFSYKAGQEFNIINNVVYMEGFPLPLGVQSMFLNWIRVSGKDLFAIYDRDY